MNAEEHPLAGKVAIVTGAAGGIGLAAVRKLVSCGAKVLAFDLKGANFSDMMSFAEDKVLIFEGDVSVVADWQCAVAECEKLGRGPDILFNNAGISGSFANVIDYTEEDFDRVMAVNVRGVFLGMKYAGARMKELGGGVIVNTSSNAGLGGSPNVFAYCGSKFAVNGMTKSAAVALAPHNIRVLAICPSPTATEMMFRAERHLSPDNPEAARSALTDGNPMGRYGTPEEMAEVLAFLVGPGASFMTGALVPVDGGSTAK